MKTPSLLKKNSSFLLFTTLTFFIASCGNRQSGGSSAAMKETPISKTTKDSIPDTTFSKIPVDRKYNDITRYIAGMKGLDGSPYTNMENDSTWIKFHKSFDDSWKELITKRLNIMDAWAATELAAERKSNLDIFYPLSGPDILHANTFFPNAKRYHLYALERNGALPDLSHMKTKEIKGYLSDVNVSLEDVFKRSYFITHEMMTALTTNKVNGTLPLICIFLVRTGHEIINVRYFHLNDDGTEAALNKDSLGTHHNDLVQVYFKNNKNTSIQMVSYMKCDLSDNAYQKNSALKNYFANMPQSTTYLKSASYLLHYAFFSLFRNLILSKSKAILEDDTGIPYKYLPKTKWDVTLYGVYVKPVSDFSGVFQDDLLKAYHDTTTTQPKKLPFSLGYHWGTNEQNLIKAQLKDSVK